MELEPGYPMIVIWSSLGGSKPRLILWRKGRGLSVTLMLQVSPWQNGTKARRKTVIIRNEQMRNAAHSVCLRQLQKIWWEEGRAGIMFYTSHWASRAIFILLCSSQSNPQFGASGTGSSCNNLIRLCAPGLPSYRPQGNWNFLHSMLPIFR